MPSPYQCKRYHHTCGCSRRKSLFLNFANANAKLAAPGFEHETGDLSSISSLSAPQRAQPSGPDSLVKGIYGWPLVGDALSSSEDGGIRWRNVGNYYLDSRRASLLQRGPTEGVIQLRACMQGRPRRRRKRGEPSAHRYARTALSTAASRPARMALGAAAEERFISVLFNSPAAPSFMHVTTLPQPCSSLLALLLRMYLLSILLQATQLAFSNHHM